MMSPTRTSKSDPIILEEPVIDETTPLIGAAPIGNSSYESLQNHGGDEEAVNRIDSKESDKSAWQILAILSVLLIGVFMSQADISLVLATYGQISSEFNQLQNSSWLLSSYMLAMCVSQPLYGKLSDIFGRKTSLQAAYLIFSFGCFLCGLSKTMLMIVIGRAIQGIGGAGMVCLVSILITDLVPLRDVASYRSYVNIVQTVGRSCGGAIGGLLTQTVGWRWTFLGQVPLILIAVILVAWKLDTPQKHHESSTSTWIKVKSIDFAGASTLSIAILSSMLLLDMGGDKIPWNSPYIVIFAGVALSSTILFCVCEKSWAKQPIFPLPLLTHIEVVKSYVLLMLANASQMALMLFIPLYFEITQNATPAQGGLYMIPAVVGNTAGGLLTGAYIKRTGRYKIPIIVGSLAACTCFTLLITTWQGYTPLWKSFFIFPGGLATGIAHSAVFVSIGASVEEKEMAIATSGLYLSGNVGGVAGLSAASSLFQATLSSDLREALRGIDGGRRIAEKALSDIEFVQKLQGRIHELVVRAYILSFRKSFVLSLGFSVTAVLVGLLVREKRLAY